MFFGFGLQFARTGHTLAQSARIARMFVNGEQGAWYDPSDMSTLFQDAAGTVPVTATGDPVGRILDISGRGNHATQATAANRPLFRDVGGLRYLEFDGVNDFLQTAANIGVHTNVSVSAGTLNTAGTAAGRFVFGEYDGVTHHTSLYNAVTDNVQVFSHSALYGQIRDGIRKVHSWTIADTVFNGWQNNDRLLVNSAATAIAANTAALAIGSRTGGAAFRFTGNIYGIVIVGRTLSGGERRSLDVYMAAKTGAVLL